jgi:hypothetical protein|tara:strand:- start:99 stop:893 length:795 start_codon:yes stop_codon:yes gene_type:complete
MIFLDKFCDEVDISNGMCVHVGANCADQQEWESSPSSIFTKNGHKTYYFDMPYEDLICYVGEEWMKDWDISFEGLKNTFPDENIGDIEVIELRVGICNHNRFENLIEFTDGFRSLTIDVDGCDYWVFASIEQEYDIIICEFNPQLMGNYTEYNFHNIQSGDIVYEKTDEIQSYIDETYIGCSYDALIKLAKFKGYYCIEYYDESPNLIFLNNKYKSKYSESTKTYLDIFNYYKDIGYPYVDYDYDKILQNPPVEIKQEFICLNM